MSSWKKYVIAFTLFSFTIPQSAFADKSYPCLKNATGKTIVWDAGWQNDRKDNNVSYQIAEILHFETNNSYTMVLKLDAESHAVKETRHFPVSSAASAKVVCKNIKIEKTAPSLSLNNVNRERTTKLSVESDLKKKPQFIRYLRQGWVRADIPRTSTPLDTCIVLGRKFLCLEEEKKRFGEQLSLVAEQIEAQPKFR